MFSIRGTKRKVFALCRRHGPSMYLWPRRAVMEFARIRFSDRMGYEMDLDNPTSFAEKLQWYKFYYKNPEIKNIVDKYNFKKYIADRLGEGHTIELYGVWDSARKIEKSWASLPECFVLKSTISGNGEHLKIIRKKSEEDFPALKEELKKWLQPRHTNLNTTLAGYYACRPRILAEKYEENISDQLYDYKIYCFSGKPYTICASYNHFSDMYYPITYYDLDWNKMDVRSGKHKNDDIPRPHHLDEMISLSKILSADFPFIRVDFFDTGDKLYLAEMTFYPGSGYVQYQPDSFNKTMGDLFVLPRAKTNG